jgi:hypothetical protein
MQNGSGEVPEPHQREHQSELAILLATLTLASATLLAASPGLIRLVLLSTFADHHLADHHLADHLGSAGSCVRLTCFSSFDWRRQRIKATASAGATFPQIGGETLCISQREASSKLIKCAFPAGVYAVFQGHL